MLTLCVLLFPSFFLITAIASLLILVLLSLLFIKDKKQILIIPAAIILIFSVLNPYFSYIEKEVNAQKLVTNLSDKKDTVYTASVTDCKVYNSYSQVFAVLTKIDGKKQSDEYKIRLGSFSRDRFYKGDIITFTGTPRTVSQIEIKDFNTPLYLRSQNVFIDFPYTNISNSSKSQSKSIFIKLRDYAKDAIYKFVPKDYDFNTADVCFAMFSGDRDGLSDDVKGIFRQSGLTHILCVSGLHLTILAGLVYRLLSGLSVHKNIKCILVICACIFYTVFTGASVSTIRACMMCCVGVSGLILGRKTDALRSVFASLLVITFVSPYSVFDISALLSFSATLGIICLSEFCPKYTGKSKIIGMLQPLLELIFVNLGATLFTLSISAYFFSEMSILSAISTFTVSFIVELLLIMLPIMLLLSPLSHVSFLSFIPFFLGSICDFLCGMIIKAANFFADFRYSAIAPVYSGIWLCLFAIAVIVLAVSITWDRKTPRKASVAAIAALSIIFSFMSLYNAIIDDSTYKITYYRKNRDDRQLSVKLSSQGYLLINADSVLCTDETDLPFDTRNGKNYLLIIPDKSINHEILSDNIKIFDQRFGIQKVYVPDNNEGREISASLEDFGIACHVFPKKAKVEDIEVNLYNKNGYLISVSDTAVKTQVLYSQSYDKDSFDKDADICAYFTRQTKNQFNMDTDTMPECSIFITRLGKDDSINRCINTNGARTVTVKG